MSSIKNDHGPYCRNLHELEVQLAEDVTEEGLLALSGRSAQRVDQGVPAHWENALYLQGYKF